MDTVDIFIISAPDSPVRISVDGEAGRASAVIPIGAEFPLDARLLPVLATAEDIKWRRVGEVAEGSTPAPAVSPDFDAEAIISGTVADVAAKIALLTPEELLSVRSAEEDREVPRKGVKEAIEKAIAASNLEDTTHADQD